MGLTGMQARVSRLRFSQAKRQFAHGKCVAGSGSNGA